MSEYPTQGLIAVAGGLMGAGASASWSVGVASFALTGLAAVLTTWAQRWREAR